MTSTKNILIALDQRSYAIKIGFSLDQLSEFTELPQASTAVIVSDAIVGPLYAERLRNTLVCKYRSVHSLFLPTGEVNKNWHSLHLIYDALIQNGCDRRTILFALGGGVVGDLTGFAAASYMRGISFVQVPTTLLAQVDSSVGGKTGINHPLSKNMIGAFHQPQMVLCDLSTLDTLPMRELRSGIAEIIKYGPIADIALMGWMESSIDTLLALDRTALLHAVSESCKIKAAIVSQDEHESGMRAILNFGHTFGHAIEAGLGYGKWLHGEAVAAGMVMAAELSCRLGWIDAHFTHRLRSLIERAGLPSKGPILDSLDNAGKYLDLMRNDKKVDAGEIRFVLIEYPGKAKISTAPESLVREVINSCCE